ncbi:hypothetical protein ACSQ67_025526 [Phaseolus vulgaris]
MRKTNLRGPPCPLPHLALEEAVGTSAEPTLATAPELPHAVQHFLRGWRQAKSGNLVTEDVLIESVFCSLESYLARILDHREQATMENRPRADEVAKPKEELDRRQAVRFHDFYPSSPLLLPWSRSSCLGLYLYLAVSRRQPPSA